MPTTKYAVPESNLSFTRPVVFEAAQAVAKASGVNTENLLIVYPDEYDRVLLPNSTVEGDDRNRRQIQAGFKLYVEALEEIDPYGQTENSVTQLGERWFIQDKDVKLTCRPFYEAVSFTLNFKFQAEDEGSAVRWRNMMRVRLRQYRETIPITFKYHYPIPNDVFAIIKDINDKKNAVTNNKIDLRHYFESVKTEEVRCLVNSKGENAQWVVADSQALINGYFDFDIAPDKGGKDREDTTWTISFTLKFNMRKPVGVVVNYPVLIYNQQIDKQFLFNDGIYPVEPRGNYRAHDLNAYVMSKFVPERLVHGDPNKAWVSPTYDDFNPISDWAYTTPVLTQLCRVDKNNLRDIFNLRDKTAWEINPLLLDFMVGEGNDMFNINGSVIKFTLFEDDAITTRIKLSIDKDLNLTTLSDMDILKTYHVRMSFMTKFSVMTPMALARLRDNPKVLQLILNFLRYKFSIPSQLDDGDIIDIIDAMEGKPGLYLMRTVQNLTFDTKILEMKNAHH